MVKHMKLLAVLAMLVLIVVPATAQDDEEDQQPPPAAEVANDEGGPVRVTGSFPVSSQNLIDSLFEPVLILEDQSGFVARDLDFTFPLESQVIGQFTSPFEVGEVSYLMQLPAEPLGNFNDVDNDGEADTGVQIFQVAFWDESYGDLFVGENDGHGWSGAYSTATTSIDPATYLELNGGSLIVWAPDGNQGFPSGYGEDGLLFTGDDPIVTLPPGYTIVTIDEEPFTFDRSREAELPLFEPDSFVPNDFSDLSYAEAFNALVDTAINEYSFTEFKDIDWEALREEFLPRFEEADENEDNAAYLFALRDFAWSIPDGHIALYGPQTPLDQDFQANIEGGLGMAVLETSDSRFLVAFLLEEGPAQEAGIELLAEITEVNGQPIEDALAEVVPYSSPFSSVELERGQQLRYLFASPVGTDYEITYLNPDAEEPETVELTSIAETDSFGYTSINRDRDFNAPQISFEILENDVAYVSVTGFGEDGPLLIETWEEFIEQAQAVGSPAIIVDLRFNGGGFSSFALRMASHFYTEEMEIYYSESYNPEIDAFFSDPEVFATEIVPPEEESLIYEGELVVLVSPACASACEFFAYQMDINDRATVIGQSGTNAIAGGWPLLFMPDDIIFALPTSRTLDFDGNIIIEDQGIELDVRVPVTEETITDTETDFVLEAALDFISEATATEAVEGGEIALGDTVTGEISPGTRVQYEFTAEENVAVDISLGGVEEELDTVLRIYVAGNEDPAVENDDFGDGLGSGFSGLEVPADLPLIIEVGGFNDAQTGEYELSIVEFEPPEVTLEEGGDIALGDIVEGTLEEGVRVRYTFTPEEDGLVDISVADDLFELDTYLRVYIEGEEEPVAENDDIELGVQVNSAIEDLEVTADQTLIIEVGGFNDTAVGDFTLSVVEGSAE